jgi:sigma-70-like protein
VGKPHGRAVRLREDGCLSQMQIARLLGVSTSRVQELEGSALRKLRGEVRAVLRVNRPPPPEQLALEELRALALGILAECDPYERDLFRKFGELPPSLAAWLDGAADELGRTGT